MNHNNTKHMETDIKNDNSDRQTQTEEEEEKKDTSGNHENCISTSSAALCVKCFSTNAKLGPVCMLHRA